MIDLIYWLSSFWVSLVWWGIELHLTFLHEDMDEGYREPYEISYALFKFTPFEIFLQLLLTIASLMYFNIYLLIPNVIVSYYNLKTFWRKDYCQHFLTRKEYSKRDNIERYTKYKLILYMVFVFATLIFSVLSVVHIIIDKLIKKTDN